MLSTRVTVKVHVLVFPYPSLAVKVTMVVPVPDKLVFAAGDWVKVVLPLQLSDMLVGLNAGKEAEQVAPKLTVVFPGQLMEGGAPSILFTVNEQVEVLLLPSVAVMVTVMVPMPLTIVPAAGDWL